MPYLFAYISRYHLVHNRQKAGTGTLIVNGTQVFRDQPANAPSRGVAADVEDLQPCCAVPDVSDTEAGHGNQF